MRTFNLTVPDPDTAPPSPAPSFDASHSGDEAAFVRLLTSHDAELRRYVRTLVPIPADAEDVFQRAAVALWRKFESYDLSQPFLPWACRFAYFEVLNYRKRQARDRLTFSEDLIESLADERLKAQARLEPRRRALHHCLADLEEADRKLLERRYEERGSVADLSIELGETAKRLYKRLETIRRKLGLCIDRHLTAASQ